MQPIAGSMGATGEATATGANAANAGSVSTGGASKPGRAPAGWGLYVRFPPSATACIVKGRCAASWLTTASRASSTGVTVTATASASAGCASSETLRTNVAVAATASMPGSKTARVVAIGSANDAVTRHSAG